MPGEKDDLFAVLAVQEGYLTAEQVEQAKTAQKGAADLGMELSLSEVAISKKLLTREQCDELMRVLRVQTGEARVVGGYEVLAKLGSGGMGVVYKARSIATNEIVALKVLPPSLARNSDLLERFRREAEITRTLSHENIVRCVELGFDKERKLHFCALEFVEGEDLAKIVNRDGKIPENHAFEIARQIAKALEHAGSLGLVHRDVKPQNIMVTPSSMAKLLDLGLARSISDDDTRLTQSGMFVGSPHYASPEQAKGERGIDIRTDIYGLGATLYHIVTGEAPFQAATSAAVLAKVVSEQIPWPADVNPDLSDNMCRIIEKTMARDPQFRYQTPAELIHDLDTAISGGTLTTEAPPRKASVFKRPAKASVRQMRSTGAHTRVPAQQSKQKSTLAVTVTAFIVVLVAGTAFLFWKNSESAQNDVIPLTVSAPAQKPSASVAGQEQRIARGKEMLDFAKSYMAEHPDDYDRIKTYFEKARDAAPGTAIELEADSQVAANDQRRKQAAIAELDNARAQADKLIAQGDIDGALAAMQSISPALTPAVDTEIQAACKTIMDDAIAKTDALFAQAEKAVAAEDTAKARSLLDELARFRFKSGPAHASTRREALLAKVQEAENAAGLLKQKEAKGKIIALLDNFLALVRKSDCDSARKELETASAQGGTAPGAEELLAAARVARSLAERRSAMSAVVSAMTNASLETASGRRSGKVEKVTPEGISLVTTIIINGRPQGETRFLIEWDKLTAAEEDRLARNWRPADADGEMARAVLAFCHDDLAGAETALKPAANHPLAEWMKEKIETARLGAIEAEARASWRDIERKTSAQKMPAADAKAALAKVDEFEKQYGKTQFAASLKDSLPALKKRLRQLFTNWVQLPVDKIQSQLSGNATASVAKDVLLINVTQGQGNHAVIPLVTDCRNCRVKFECQAELVELFLRKNLWRGCINIIVKEDHFRVRTYVTEDPAKQTLLTHIVGNFPFPPTWHLVEFALIDSNFMFSLDGKILYETPSLPVVGVGDTYIDIYGTPRGPFQLRNVWYAIEDEQADGGTVSGIVGAKDPANAWVELKADGDGVPVRYLPQDTGAGPDKKAIATIQTLISCNRASITWKRQDKARILVSAESAPLSPQPGAVIGVVLDKGTQNEWLDIKPDNGPLERYMVRWIGGAPNQGGGPDKPMMQIISGINIGDRVKAEWMVDARKRVIKLDRLPAP